MPGSISSFDVFDTLLTRRVGSPSAMFLAVGLHLSRTGRLPCSAFAFAALREHAEQRAFQNAGGFDSRVTLDDIAAELAMGLGIDKATLLSVEMDFEKAQLVPLAAGVKRLRTAREAGDRIVFISDMYLDEATIRQLLIDHRLFQSGDSILVSSAQSKSKRSGALFKHLMEVEGVAPGAIVHHGNDLLTDVSVPRRLGIRTQPFAAGNLNRYETVLDHFGPCNDGLSSRIAGAARIVRAMSEDHSSRHRALVDVSASVAAPFLIGFVMWLLARALDDGVKRLYFVARDGQLLMAIAAILVRKLELDIELTYLMGSRRAWQIAAFGLGHPCTFAAMIPDVRCGPGREPVTLDALLDRFDITADEMADELMAAGIWTRERSLRADRQVHRSDSLTEDQLARITELFAEDGPVRELALARSKRARESMLGYLGQVGVGDEISSGIVDLGAGATLYNALAHVLESDGKAIPTAYYLGQRAVPDRLVPRFVSQRYLFDSNIRCGFFNSRGLIGFLEAVCVADHGSVVGYRCGDTGFEPVLARGTHEAALRWGHSLVRSTILDTVESLQIDSNWRTDIREPTTRVFDLFWTSPTRDEARVWGEFPFDDGWGQHCRTVPLARPYDAFEVLRRMPPHRHWWHDAAVTQSAAPVRMLFRIRRFVMRVMRKVRQRFPHVPTRIPG